MSGAVDGKTMISQICPEVTAAAGPAALVQDALRLLSFVLIVAVVTLWFPGGTE